MVYKITVCRNAFLDILGRKSHMYAVKLDALKKIIKSLKADDTHYCRNKSLRQYLSAALNITMLYKMYKQKADEEIQVKFSYFDYVFTTFFNVGFGSPKTDACSTCIELEERIKNYKLKKPFI